MRYLAGIFIAASCCAQVSFEVAAIRPVNTGAPYITVGASIRPDGTVLLSGMPLKTLISVAYQIPFARITGGEAWMEKEEYDVEAKIPPGAGVTNLRYSLFGIEDDRIRVMLQSLLADRFQLRVRRATESGTVYLLERTEKPLALLPSQQPERSSSVGYAGARWVITSTTMPQLANFASGFVVRAPVEDRTQLGGVFDYKQTQLDDQPNYTDNTDSFLRLLSEVGLRLSRSRGPVESLAIEAAVRPGEN